MTRFRALDTTIEVAIADDVPAIAHALIRPYPRVELAELHYELRGSELRRDGELLVVEDPRDLVPRFEMDLYEQVLARARPAWILHAAALAVNDRALVLCGASGAGKTTLTLALAARGFRLLTEELVSIDKSGVVRGLPRPLHVPAKSPQRAKVPLGWDQLPYPIRGRDGIVRENVLVVPPSEAIEIGELPLHAIVRMGHGADWPVQLARTTPALGFQRLWDRALRQDDAGLEAATEISRAHGSWAMSSTTEGEALALIAPLLK